jgi:aminopeptidase N
MRRTVLAGLACLSFVIAHAETTTELPRGVRPIHYEIAVAPHAAELSFDGRVGIDIDVEQPTSTITLHALDLTIRSAAISQNSRTPVTAQVTTNPKQETATFAFPQALAKGRYRLAIDYAGKINTQAYGLFALDYDTASGKQRALYTQFEVADARRFVPSWDEPSYKATFTLEATVPANQMAISNMPVAKQTAAGDGRMRVQFGTSPKMSSYLLFFSLGDFERITAKAGPTEIGVVTQRGMSSQGQFILEASQAVLREFNDYFATPFPLPKLDNIAAPGRSQFFSAMENWGAIFTFEHSILMNPAISTQADKQRAFGVAAHEIAHQWFGDLVTMAWWDDLWLNEGFATWMASRTTAKLHPEWNTRLNSVGGREGAMGLDSLITTHPVVQQVPTAEAATQAFDAIAYQKGGAVIRMIEEYVGEDAWRAGLRAYMRKHAYGNTVSDDLWREIETAAKKPIVAIAHDFTLQPGVPMLRIAEPVCNNNVTTLQVTQGEFARDRPNKKPLPWRVPVIAQSLGNSQTQRVVVENGAATITLPSCAPVVVNAGQSGYYRTLYSNGHFAQLKSSFAQLPAIDQLGVLTDTWALGLNTDRSSADALELIAATPTTADPAVWRTIAGILGDIDDMNAGDETGRKHARAFASARLNPILNQIGWIAQRDEADSVAVLRNSLITTLGALGDESVIAEARKRYRDSKTQPDAMPGALRRVILAIVARHADTATWEQLLADARQEKTPLLRDNLYGLLSRTQDAALAKRALELALTDEPGATNGASMISGVAGLHPDMAFDFAMANMDAVNKRADTAASGRFYAGLASNSIDPAMIAKVRSYADKYLPPELRRSADTAIARIENRLKVRRESLPAIAAWLARYAPATS